MDRIKINLLDWESAPCAIYTNDVNLDKAETELYSQMRMKGYDDNEINTYLNNGGNETDREKFLSRLWDEEETSILKSGGIYYEDMIE